MVSRQSDAAVAPLLGTAFDTAAPGRSTIDHVNHRLTRRSAIGVGYIKAARAAHDTGLFAAEIGRFFDASVIQAMIDSPMAEFISCTPRPEALRRGSARLAKRSDGGPWVTTTWARDRGLDRASDGF